MGSKCALVHWEHHQIKSVFKIGYCTCHCVCFACTLKYHCIQFDGPTYTCLMHTYALEGVRKSDMSVHWCRKTPVYWCMVYISLFGSSVCHHWVYNCGLEVHWIWFRCTIVSVFTWFEFNPRGMHSLLYIYPTVSLLPHYNCFHLIS